MADSRMRRAAQALRDPWSLVAVGVGAGAAWALALPIAGVAAVGIGMLGVAGVVGAVSGKDKADDSRPEPDLRPGTKQFQLVATLESYLADLTHLQAGPLPSILSTQAADAVSAATSARTVALEVAASIDALDGALHEAAQVARRMSTAQKVAAPLDRMKSRRQELLAKLTTAVDGVGELYTKLLELITTPELTSDGALGHGPDPVAEVNESLDGIREAFAELDSAARKANNSLNATGPG